jgi:aspartyl-tRNA(Asn)/glutamyl-tRNA(Gln) amidotransferase subunit B
VHLEEDTGTMLHAGGVLQSASSSLIDLNRAGVPLMEIVGEPDLRTPEQAREYLHKLRQILVYLGVSDGNLESGSFRCDANVSLRPPGSVDLGVKVEVKNMNSFRAVQKALEFEIDRQTGMLQAGQTIDQETRGWVEGQMATVSQRGKEHAHDYRYFPEPDLPPLEVSREMVEEIRRRLPELPEAKQERFASQYNLSDYDASVVTQSKGTADAFEEVAKKVAPKVAANWLMGDVARISNETATELLQSGLGVRGLIALLDLVEKGSINSATAKSLLDELYVKGGDPAAIVAQRGLAQVSDEGELSKLVDEVIAAHANVVADYKGGKQQALQALVGQIMKATKGRANAQAVSQLLRERLDN